MKRCMISDSFRAY